MQEFFQNPFNVMKMKKFLSYMPEPVLILILMALVWWNTLPGKHERP